MCNTLRDVGLLVLIALLLATGCGGSPGTGEIELGVADDGSQVELTEGQILVVTLDSNPSTGYSWQRAGDQGGVLEQMGEAQFREGPQAKGKVGAPGQEQFRFKATKAGETTLELHYRRPWEKDAKPEETFAVQITVR